MVMNWHAVYTNPRCEHRAEAGMYARGYTT
jgi:hypothetical protein